MASAEVPPLIHLLNDPLSAVVSEEGVRLHKKSADVPVLVLDAFRIDVIAWMALRSLSNVYRITVSSSQCTGTIYQHVRILSRSYAE